MKLDATTRASRNNTGRRKWIQKSLLTGAVISACAIPSISANAGGTIDFGDGKSVTIGFGMRGDLTATENAANNGSDYSQNFNLENARIYLSGTVNQYIQGMFTYEGESAGQNNVIDANVQLKLLPNFTIWAGRMLSPSDRANMAGPFYSLGGGWDGNNITARYSYDGGIIGRDDGVAAVGSFLDGALTYAGGVYEGHTEFNLAPALTTAPAGNKWITSTSKQEDGLMYAGRVQVDFWDPEGATLYGTGDYRGGANILAIGLSGRYQKNGSSIGATTTSTPVVQADYSLYSLDFLLEKKDIGPGALHIGAAFYDYDTDGAILSEQGDAYQAELGYTFNEKVGWGKLQPFVQYQKFDADAASTNERKYNVGLAYIIDPYNAEITAKYVNDKFQGGSTTDSFLVTTQFQF